MTKGKIVKRPYTKGDPVMVGIVERGKPVEWKLGTVVSTVPFVMEADGKTYNRDDFGILIKKPEAGTIAPKVDFTVHLNPVDLKNALVKIIQEGDTDHPNATVKRIVNIAKEAIGELHD